MSKRKRTGDIGLFSTEVLSDSKEMLDTSSFSASPGPNRKKKGPGRSSILAINSGSGLEPYQPPPAGTPTPNRGPGQDPYEPPIANTPTPRSRSARFLDPYEPPMADTPTPRSTSVRSMPASHEDTEISAHSSTLPKQMSTDTSTEKSPLLLGSRQDQDDNMEDSYKYNSRYRGDMDDFRFSYTPVPNHFSSIQPEIRPRRAHELSNKEFDSLDYDICYNVPYKDQLRTYDSKTYTHMEIMRWVLVCIIGVLTGLVAFCIDMGVKQLFKLKYSQFESVLDMTMDDGRVAIGFLVLLGFNVVFVLVAALLIFFEPVAAGSGIPEIKCYLNGVKVPHVTRIGTFIAKAVGVLFSVAGGFLVGKEGPMIHSGAIIGAGLPQFRSFIFKYIKIPYHYFRSDRDKRDFVSCGAAAGVAAAFGAPIGGVLFSLEEGSSFWNQSLTWRTLFCCFSATFTLNFLNSLVNTEQDIGFLGSPGLVDFGVFDKEETRLWNAYHLVIFVLMGATGGLLGALFNSLNINLTKYRNKYFNKRKFNRSWRVAEVILIAMVTTFTVFVVAMFLGTCLPEHVPKPDKCGIISGDQSFINETKDFFCPGHTHKSITKTYYNDMATLMFNSQEEGIKQLFHQNGAFTLPTLLILFIFYFFIACWTYGAGVPSGLFIPCLMIGATYGRFVATVFAYLANFNFGYFGWLITLYPGTYSLIGAASFLGGVVRMMISLTVILIESTNEIEYGLPILLTVTVAKWVGDLFNAGIYDTHIELKKTPFLEWESPRQLDKLAAKDVMSTKNFTYLYPITRVRSVVQLLKTTSHSGFLIVSPVRPGFIRTVPISVKQVTPQLYMRESMHGGDEGPSFASEHIRPPSTVVEVEEHSENEERRYGSPPFLDKEADMCTSYTLPSHRQMFSDDSSLGTPGVSKGQKSEDSENHELVFRGIILRHQLVSLLKNKVFFNESDGPQSQKRIDHVTLTYDYPRHPSIFKIDKGISETEKNMLMDLSTFMNPSPYTISVDATLPQVFTLFRTMGLRHLPVIKEHGLVAGIITRHDLTHEKLHALRHKKKMRERAETDAQKHGERFRTINYQSTSTSEHV